MPLDRLTRKRLFLAGCAFTGVAAITLPTLAQKPTSGPVARYDMRAGTVSGMAGMGGMSMMFGGGGNNLQHELLLRLGSSNAPDKGKPKADHFMPSGAKLGKSVALTTPAQTVEDGKEDFQRPKGRLLLYWGCGAHAGKGQPVVIDFARLAAGQMPPGLFSGSIPRDFGPTQSNSRTFGRWPSEDRKYVKADSSLIGAHRIAGNYSPEIAFSLTKDFMAPLRARSNSLPGGVTNLSWGGIAGATGYYSWAMGGKMGPNGEMGDMVWWTSSSSREFGGGLGDWLAPGTVAGLAQKKVVMPSTQTSCTLPAEVKRDAPDFLMGMLTAFGPEENFSYPPRPADHKAAWALQWTARIRHRSTTSWMINAPDMGGMNSGADDGGKPRCKGGLGGMLGGGLLGGGC